MSLPRDSYTKSPWQGIPRLTKANSNNQIQNVYDVIVIGAGITGITTALTLQKAGKNCLVIDGGSLGFGTTGGTTAHINTFFDSTYPEIESNFGNEATKLVAQAGKIAIKMISSLVKVHHIDCDLETKSGYLYAETEKESAKLSEIFELSKSVGIKVDRSTTNGLPISFIQSLKFEEQAQFHPLKYLQGLAAAFLALGGTIRENTFINEVKQENNHCIAISEDETFSAYNVVYATHIPPGINKFSFRCAPYRSYVLGVHLNDDSLYPENLAYDMKDPYHYFRTHVIDGQKILIVGGADHKTGHQDSKEAFEELEKYVSQRFILKDIPYRWSSQYYIPADGLPYIGRMDKEDDRIFVATGYNGNGMTWGTMAGNIISDLILDKENPFTELFDPCRIKPIAGFSEFVKENADVAYHFVLDRFKTEDLASFSEIGKGEGKIVDYEGTQLAIFKDKDGILSALSPVCTHAGCIVSFNTEEKSWDCPCHGGRFNLEGRVLCGPPSAGLKPIEIGN